MNTPYGLDLLEAGLTFLTLILASSLAYKNRQVNTSMILQILISLGIFLGIYALIVPFLREHLPYYGYLAFLGISLYVFAVVFLRKYSANLFIFLVPLLVTIISLKGLVMFLFYLCNIMYEQSFWGWILFEVVHTCAFSSVIVLKQIF